MTEARLRLTPHYSVGNSSTSVDLTPFEGRILTALAFNRELTSEDAVEILWPDPDQMPDFWYSQIVCLITRIRNKLRPFGWAVINRYGYGWRLEKHGTDSRTAQETQRQAA